MPKITLVLVNCDTENEAERIGRKILRERLISCFDIIPRFLAAYFWPPKSGKIETSKGATLVLETLNRHILEIEREIKKIHSDKLPFIGSFEIKVSSKYFDWVRGELKNNLKDFLKSHYKHLDS